MSAWKFLHNFHNVGFKLKHKFCLASGPACALPRP